MRNAIDNDLSQDQLRRIDRWTLLLLASVLMAAFLTAFTFNGKQVARFDDWRLKSDLSESKDRVRQTTRPDVITRPSRDSIGTSRKLPRSEAPNGVQGFETLRRNGELRQSLPVLY